MNAAAQNKVADRENIDPMVTMGNDTDDPFRSKSLCSEDDQNESSFETVIYHSKENESWSHSTPATVPRGRKSYGRRKSNKSKAARTTGMYPELSLYPDISSVGGDLPTTTTEDFSKVADGILEEMNTRLTGILVISLANDSKTANDSGTSQQSSARTNFSGCCDSSQRITFFDEYQFKAPLQ